jgi:GNAT superfamily N-acetyltransferase
MTTSRVRRATFDDRRVATAALASAFAEDPILSWLIGERDDVEARLHHIFGHFLGTELAKELHAVDIVDGGGGVAIWHEVDDWKTPNRQLPRMLPSAIRTFGRRIPRALRTLAMVEKAHPSAPHVYLAFLGVSRDRQGRGLGGAMLASMTERCDTEGLAAYLENSNPRNEALYARHGFVARGPVTLPSGAPPLTAMWREPR